MQYGTWTTIDCPTGGDIIEDSAQKFLTVAFSKINGKVRKVLNPHDFGSYPSFEIDYPWNLEHESDDDDCTELDQECPRDIWHDAANRIEKLYQKKFRDNL